MSNKFVADGFHRFLRAKRVASTESNEKSRPTELASTDPGKKSLMRKQRKPEYADHQPSPGTLW
jgi:hypothetical protein